MTTETETLAAPQPAESNSQPEPESHFQTSNSNIDFAALDADDEPAADASSVAIKPAPAAAAEPASAKPAATAATSETQPAVAVQQPAAEPAAIVAPAPAPASPALPQRTEEEILGDLRTHYSITPEDAAQIISAPEEVLPKMAARVHMNAVNATLDAVVKALPGYVNSILEHRDLATKAQQEVFANDADLLPHADKVFEVFKVYRQMNPSMRKDELIPAALQAARTFLNMPKSAPVTVAAAPVPFQPGGVFNAPAPAPVVNTNPWAALADDDLRDGM